MHLLRRQLKAALTDRAILPRLLANTMASDAAVIAMGRRLVAAIRRAEDGAGAIALGLSIGADGWFALRGIPSWHCTSRRLICANLREASVTVATTSSSERLSYSLA